jgi:hypothetical protein
VEGGTRSSFGFVGDLGVLPSDPNAPANLDGLEDLVNNTGTVVYPSWSQDPGTGIWYGWRGPYINEYIDPWGRNYYYNPNTGNPLISAIIGSVGPDGLPSTPDDITITIRRDEVFSLVGGNTLDNCGAGTDCNISISFPNGTTIRTDSLTPTTADNPIYNTGDTLLIPIGIRRIVFTLGGNPYLKLLYVNNGPLTVANFREPGTCPE